MYGCIKNLKTKKQPDKALCVEINGPQCFTAFALHVFDLSEKTDPSIRLLSNDCRQKTTDLVRN